MSKTAVISPMRRLKPFLSSLVIAAAVPLFVTGVTAQPRSGAAPVPPPAPFVMPATSTAPRMIVFISDLHFGLAKTPDGRWSPKEDFRWPDALKGFLDEMGRRGNDRVDLVIVGDFLDLWQPPDTIACDSSHADDLGCTVPEMVSIARTVIDAHRNDLALLRDFAKRGDNRLHIIPGNHDAALLLPEVWNLLSAPLDVPAGHVALVTGGFWTTPDGRVVAEHGHQVGNDVNRYEHWPVITRNRLGTTYLDRSWGERLVYQVFNSREQTYEIIDNISPLTVGVKYLIADRGFRSAADAARLIQFMLFETSPGQKLGSLGASRPAASRGGTPPPPPDANDLANWDIEDARQKIGYRLFLDALAEDDPLRAEIEGPDATSQALRAELAARALDKTKLTDEEVRTLCDHLAFRKAPEQCVVPTASALIESSLVPRRHVVGAHLDHYLRNDDRLLIFVYGHTHDFEEGWPLKVSGGGEVTVHNTGAFQRTVDEAGFLARVAQKNLAASEALRTIKLDDLPPCYSAVLVTYSASGVAESKTWRWHQKEGGIGTLVEPGDDRCN